MQIQKVVKIIAANDSISSYIPENCKRGEYSPYSPERRAKIAKLAVEIGVAKSARKMLVELGKIFQRQPFVSFMMNISKNKRDLN